MDVSVGPQILEHISKSVQITSYDVKWIPSSARFVVMGAFARATGCLQVYELDGVDLQEARGGDDVARDLREWVVL